MPNSLFCFIKVLLGEISCNKYGSMYKPPKYNPPPHHTKNPYMPMVLYTGFYGIEHPGFNI